jgi:tripartite-type tricarboxylate transporter receptor subunit TctC
MIVLRSIMALRANTTSRTMVALWWLVAVVVGGGVAFGGANLARAQSYPAKPIKMIVPFPAGGATDTAARLVAQRLQMGLGQTIVIENQGGAGGTIGARQVATASPDGYTIMMGSVGTFGSHPLLYKLDYDPVKAFAPVATAVVDKGVLVAGPSLSAKTIQDLVREAKANPGKLNYGNAIGIGPHFVAEMFKLRAGVDIVHIPYRGGAPMISDLLAGQIHMTINGKSVLFPHIQAGKLRPLAVTSAQRWPELPDVPTLVEVGYMDAPYDTLFGVVAPMGTPAAVIDKLNATVNEGLRAPETLATLAKLGIEPKLTTPQEFAAIIAEEAPKWADVVRKTGIKIVE